MNTTPQYTVRNTVTDTRIHRKNIADDYFILNYKTDTDTQDAGATMEDFPEKYNSVIFDTRYNEPLSIAPSAPISLDEFIHKYPIITDEIYVSKISEGTLIQLFYNPRKEEWEIATRSSIGGNNRHCRTEYGGFCFRKQKTFRQMFYDALLQLTPIERPALGEDPNELVDGLDADVRYNPSVENYDLPLSDIPFIKTLSEIYCYTFVLSHPSNPQVDFVFCPTLTLVAVYELERVSGTIDEFHAWMLPPYYACTLIPHEYRKVVRVQQPQIGWLGMSLYEKMSTHMFDHWNSPGLMVTNIQTGERAMLENPQYKYASELRGNHQNLQYQYFELCKSRRLAEFLDYFPIFSDLFMHFHNQYMEFTFRVYSVYVHYYVNNNREQLIDPFYHSFASKIHHTMVKPTMMPGQRRIFITRELVQHYFDIMPTAQIVGILSKML
jgi:hypothetical protein